MAEKIGKSVALLLTAYLTRQDIKSRLLSSRVLLGMGILGVIYLLLARKQEIFLIIESILPGFLLCIFSFFSKEALGYGDGIAVMVIGLWCGGVFVMQVLLTGFVLSGTYAAILLLRGHRENIPFLPFLLAAMEVSFWFA